jgi:hypothetical protein
MKFKLFVTMLMSLELVMSGMRRSDGVRYRIGGPKLLICAGATRIVAKLAHVIAPASESEERKSVKLTRLLFLTFVLNGNLLLLRI